MNFLDLVDPFRELNFASIVHKKNETKDTNQCKITLFF